MHVQFISKTRFVKCFICTHMCIKVGIWDLMTHKSRMEIFVLDYGCWPPFKSVGGRWSICRWANCQCWGSYEQTPPVPALSISGGPDHTYLCDLAEISCRLFFIRWFLVARKINNHGRDPVPGGLHYSRCLLLRCAGRWAVGTVIPLLMKCHVAFSSALNMLSANVLLAFLYCSRRFDPTKAMPRATFWRERTCTGYLWVCTECKFF